MNILIVGCGRVGAESAQILSAAGCNVTVLDKNENSLQRLGADFNGATLVGNGIDMETLREAGVEKADAAVVVTNGDNTNVVAAQVIKKIFRVPKVMTRVYDPRRAYIYQQMGLDVVSGTTLFAGLIRGRVLEERK
jgi:trk system potassium uptake protein TrkA